MKKKPANFYEVASFLFRFEEMLDDIEATNLSQNSKELLASIFDEWAKHKIKDKNNKALANLLQGFSSYFHERIPVRPKRTKK